MGVVIFSNVKACAAFMLISILIIYTFVLFYSNYLLYRFEERGINMGAEFECNKKIQNAAGIDTGAARTEGRSEKGNDHASGESAV